MILTRLCRGLGYCPAWRLLARMVIVACRNAAGFPKRY